MQSLAARICGIDLADEIKDARVETDGLPQIAHHARPLKIGYPL